MIRGAILAGPLPTPSAPTSPTRATTSITADLPGFEKENIHLDLYDDALTISAERHSEHENKDKRDKYLCCERSYGSYSRTFNVTGIDTAAIKAKYDKGVLELILPKAAKEEKSAKRLEIE